MPAESPDAGASAPVGLTVLRAAARAAAPWRNGTGSTAEIVVRKHLSPTPTTEAPPEVGFDWRMSIATVSADGAFSAFPGVDRALMALSTPGLTLTDGDAEVVLAQHDVHCFAGENAVAAVGVTGATLDLNLMCARDRRLGSLTERVLSGFGTIEMNASVGASTEDVVIVLLQGWLVCRAEPGPGPGPGPGPWTTLAQHDAVLFPPGRGLQVVGLGRVAIARVRPI